MPSFPIDLLPGDHLLYGAHDLFGVITSVKTWSPAVHIEVYTGDGCAVASRNGLGVNHYAVRREGLIAVLRPNEPVDLETGLKWFYATACGQKYDWLGLLCFTLAVKQGSPNKMFCSEFAKAFDQACDFDPFRPGYPSDKVAPGDFAMSPAFTVAWLKPGVRF